jgi:shikimate dehydrogenase
MKVHKAALLGRSLTHSISPQVHSALFPIVQSKAKSDFDSLDYSNIECADEEDFLSCVRSGLDDGFTGFNVTFPYKYIASTLAADEFSIVRKINSANTIRCDNPDQIISTDGLGFRFALEKSFPEMNCTDYSLTILGNGGASRAVLNAIEHLGWRRISIAARFHSDNSASNIIPFHEIKRDEYRQFIVQATPVGQRTSEALLDNFDWRMGDIAMDLVYNPLRTKFLDIAASKGARAIDGLGMLIEQAALSQYFWLTGNESSESILSDSEHRILHNSLSKLVASRWDVFAS